MFGSVLRCSLSVGFSLALLAIYEIEIATKWSYMGFSPIASTWGVVSVLCLAAFLPLMVPTAFSTRSFLLTIINYVLFIPSAVIVATENSDGTHATALLISMSLLYAASYIRMRPLRPFKVKRSQLMLVLICSVILMVLVLAARGGIARFNLNILNVYEIRADQTASMPAAVAYLFSAVSKVVVPISLIMALNYKSRLLAGIMLTCALLMFAMTGHKSVVFLPFAVTGIYIFMKNRSTVSVISVVFLVVTLISLLELSYYANSENIAFYTSFIIRRIFFTPPLLDSFYVDFFSAGKKILWSTSRFGLGLHENPYTTTAPFLIGLNYFSSDAAGANSGIIGSGFAHAGLIGVAVYSALLGAIIAALHSFGRLLGHAFVACASLSIVVTIANTSDLSTVVFTHGLAVLFLLLLVFPSKIEAPKEV